MGASAIRLHVLGGDSARKTIYALKSMDSFFRKGAASLHRASEEE